jgi:hypothetical protein
MQAKNVIVIAEHVTATTNRSFPELLWLISTRLALEKNLIYTNEYHYSGAAEFIQNG